MSSAFFPIIITTNYDSPSLRIILKTTSIKLAFDYVEKFRPQKKAQLEKLQKELEELGLSKYAVAKLIEVMPKNAPMAKAILMKENGINEEKVSKVVAILNRKGS